MADSKGFSRWHDWASRVDLFGTMLGLFFDWKLWLPVGGAAMIAFLSAIAEGKSPFDVFVMTTVLSASIGVITIAILLIVRAIGGRFATGKRTQKNNTESSAN